MGLTAFDSDLGLQQGRVARSSGAPGTGAFALVLGHAQPGVFATLETGDVVELAQDVVLAGDHTVVAHAVVRGPASIPAGYEWKLQWLVDGLVLAQAPVPISRTVAVSLAAVVADLGGTHELALRLVLEGPAGLIELELPGVWLDDVVLAQVERPAVLNPVPAPAEREVPRTSVVRFDLVDAGGSGVGLAATQVWVGGVLAVDGGQVQPAFAGPGAGIAPIARGFAVILVPLVPFTSQAEVTVRITATTLNGAGQLSTEYAFSVEDRTSPSLLAAFASDLRQLELVFDEPVVAPPTAVVRLVPETSPAVTPAVLELHTDGAVARVRLDQPLSPRARYRVEAQGLTDRSGNAVAPPFDRAWLVPLGQQAGGASRFALWRMLPRHLRRADETGDLKRLITCLQDVTDLLLGEGDRWLDVLDLRRTPEPYLDLMLADLGNPFPFALDLHGKRRLVATLVQLYRRKGTDMGIEQALRFFFGLAARTRPYVSQAARLGRARLGRDFRLGPSDRFQLYAFDLVVDRVLTAEEQRQVRWLVDYAKPAHTHLVTILEPAVMPPALTWRLGRARLAQSTILSTT